MNRCPQEILDRFIDHLYDDRAALGNCVMAFRPFQAAGHHHLFWRVRLHRASRCRTLLNLFQCRAELGTHVKLLTLDNTDGSSELARWLWSDKFTRLAAFLGDVSTLTIRAVDFRRVGAPWTTLAQLPVREVYVYMSRFTDVRQAGTLFQCFPALEEFDFWWNEWDMCAPEAALRAPYLNLSPTDCGPLVNLRVVSVGECPCIELAAWLLATDSAKRINLLSFHLSKMDLISASVALMVAAADSLKQLCIDCVDYPRVPHVDQVSDKLSLVRLDGLQSLTIQQLTIPAFEWLIGLLSTVSPDAKIRDLELAFVQETGHLGLDEGRSPDYWHRLDETLDQPPFAALQQLTLSFYSADNGATPDERMISRMLPRCGMRRLISIVDVIQ